jgi:hypothetical protein
VLILWAWTVLLSGFILFPLYISSVNAVIPFGALALGVVLYTLFHPSLRRQNDLGPEGEPPIGALEAAGPAAAAGGEAGEDLPTEADRPVPPGGVRAATAAPSGEL